MKKILIEIEKNILYIKTYKDKCIHKYIQDNLSCYHKKTNIYLGKLITIKKNIEATFVDYGALKYGFLPLNDIIKSKIEYKTRLDKANNFQIVQIIKEERGMKGAFLTSNINIIGYFIILYPTTKQHKVGISKKISTETRYKLRCLIKRINLPKNINIILRTTTEKMTLTDLSLDLNILLEQWKFITIQAKKYTAPNILYQENNKIIQIIRDYLKEDITSIIINNRKILMLTNHYTKYIQKKFLTKIKLLPTNKKNFTTFIEQQFTKKITLPSGGTLIITKTEALIAIDVNSAKYKKGSDSEETAVQINIEAVNEITRYCRLKNLSGIIIIDFIDMQLKKNNLKIENRFINAIKEDEAKITLGKISKFGTLELIRQNIINTSYNEKKNLLKKKNIFIYLQKKLYLKNYNSAIVTIYYNEYINIIKKIHSLIKNKEKNEKTQIIFSVM